jgi:predicted ester cyclase
MTIEDNKALVRSYFEAVDARRDSSVVDEFLAADFVSHNPSPGFGPDREGQKQAFEHFLAAAPDSYHVLEDMVAEGDRVSTRVTAYGTQTGELFGIPPTGNQMVMTGIVVHRISDGKIAEHWHNIDMLGGLVQLGAIQLPGPPAATE